MTCLIGLKMTDGDLSYKGSDPGAVQYGNFINYYSFHSTSNRLENLSPNMFSTTNDDSYICLDVGCNTGDLTRDLHKYLMSIFPSKQVYILGVDIDPVLIQRAVDSGTTKSISFQNVDVMKENSMDTLKSFMKAHNKIEFDVVFCFSITMWIHLNHGDEGLERFINFMKNITKSLILEAQPWRCYKTAYRRMKRSNADFPLFKTIKIRENVEDAIEKLIVQSNFIKIEESSPSPWNRKVQSFQRIN